MEALERLANLYVAVVADTLDQLGLRDQVLDSAIRPQTTAELVVGPAYTIAAAPSDVILENPYEHEIAAVDAVPPGSVLVLSTEHTLDAAVWGELLATRAQRRECRAAVVDGAVRDLRMLRHMGVPVWASAVNANDSRGRLQFVGHGDPIVCGGVTVSAGDIVLADLDGVVIVPAHLVDDVARRAEEKVGKEQLSRRALAAGASAASVYAEHGIL